MYLVNKVIYLLIACLLFSNLHAQRITPGFNKKEYIEMMLISARTTADSTYYSQFKTPANFRMIYQSHTMGLDNLWDLWLSQDSIAVISIRGTTASPDSWLENIYAAMVPAKGTLQLQPEKTFPYTLSNNPRAAVHVGWLVGMAFLAREIVPAIDSLYQRGVKDYFIVGHSQGGGIAYLLTAYLYHLQKQNLLSIDIHFKTYCSAAPKPGNLYFAYEYESLTQNGWAYNIVNAADWVPETPFSIQTIDDFNDTNPFRHADALIKRQRFPKNIALRHVYKKLDKPSRKAQANYEKYLGRMTSKMVGKKIEGIKVPAFVSTNNYVRTSTSIVLTPDKSYYEIFPEDNTKIFNHHFHKPYLFLAEKLETAFYEEKDMVINGVWELKYITGTRIAFEGLYPDKKPFIIFNYSNSEVSGNTGCNPFTTTFERTGNNNITIHSPKASSMMYCEGKGEIRFVQLLKNVNRYQVTGDLLSLYQDEIEVLRFKKME